MGLKRLAAIFFATLCIFCLTSCAYTGGRSEPPEKTDILALELSALEEYIEIGEYKEIKITLGERDRGEAVWDAVIKASNIKGYPEKQVYYYMDQLRGQYRYYAEQAGVSYEQMLEKLGIDEGDILREAKELTKGDIIYAIVVKKENISLSDDEKQTLFSKYVDKYVSEYGYTKEYVEQNMADEIYGSMLYDKTTEFLIVNNIFE